LGGVDGIIVVTACNDVDVIEGNEIANGVEEIVGSECDVDTE